MFTNLFDKWQQPQTIVLTPNQRQARYLHQGFDEAQREAGKTSWPTLPIYPFSAWLNLLWQESDNELQLLNPTQWQYLWEKVITSKHPELLSLSSKAIEAWTLCNEYLIDIHNPVFTYNDDSELWCEWAKKIEAYLKEHRCLDNSQLLSHLMCSSKLTLPSEIFLMNFIEFTPLQKQYLEWLAQKGVNIVQKQLGFENNEVVKFKTADPREDLSSMVKWAITAAETKTVACVIPELSTKKDQIDYLFKAYLDDTSLYTISLGKSLFEYPFIKRALLSLNFDDNKTPEAWVNAIQQELKAKHWPFERVLSSEEYQLLDAWHHLLENVMSLSLIQETFSFAEFQAQLIESAKNTLFQPKTSTKTKIHVLGILEAAGLTFDAVWVSNMHDRIWPSSGFANPFLPKPLRQKLQLPHANSQQDFIFCEHITKQLRGSAPYVIFSYPQHDGENLLRESPLIRTFSLQDLTIPTHVTKAEKLLGQSMMESIEDDNAPQVDIALLQHRGSQVFKDQAACPFRAYAKHRLGANSIELPQLGFRSVQRGQIIHAILEKIWHELQSHEKLISLSESKLYELLAKYIEEVLKDYITLVPDFFIKIEKERLQKLLLQWLYLEKQRESFVVIVTEEKFETTFAGFPLKLRIDRIDKIAENEYLILDYKTSLCSTNDWFGDRPDEPQLPLYCVISALPVSSIAFAQIRANEMKLKKTDKVADYKNEWEAQLQLLAEEFLRGHAKVQPKYGDETCRYCDLSALCRVTSC